VGDTITEADVRLFTTLARFDAVYHGHFKCNRPSSREMPVLWAYARDLFTDPRLRRHHRLRRDAPRLALARRAGSPGEHAPALNGGAPLTTFSNYLGYPEGSLGEITMALFVDVDLCACLTPTCPSPSPPGAAGCNHSLIAGWFDVGSPIRSPRGRRIVRCEVDCNLKLARSPLAKLTHTVCADGWSLSGTL
jgi:hypothetical protein